MFLLFLTSLRGISVRGPMIGKQHAYVLARDWLGAPPAAADPDAALGWLARRYLAGHAPATDRDLAKWAGLPLRDARRALREIAADLVEDARTGWSGWREPRTGPPLGMGAPRRPARIAPAGGRRRPGGRQGRRARLGGRSRRCRRPGCWASSTRCCTAGSPARRCWAGTSRRSSEAACSARSPWPAAGRSAPGRWPASQVSLTLLEPVSAAHRRALEADAEDVRRFLGLAGAAGQ